MLRKVWTFLAKVVVIWKVVYISIPNKVVKIIKETIEMNLSHDKTWRYTRNNLDKFTLYIINANTLFTIHEIGIYVKC